MSAWAQRDLLAELRQAVSLPPHGRARNDSLAGAVADLTSTLVRITGFIPAFQTITYVTDFGPDREVWVASSQSRWSMDVIRAELRGRILRVAAVLGEHAPETDFPERGTARRLLQALLNSQRPLSPAELVNQIGGASRTISNVLADLKEQRLVTAISRGQWVATERARGHVQL